MLALTILSIFILIIVLIIFLEYRNEKKYQEKRRQQRQTSSRPKRSAPPTEAKEEVAPKPKREPVPAPEPEPEVIREEKPKAEPKPEPAVEPEPVVEIKPELEVKEEPKPEPEPQIEVPKETKELPEANYPQFTHVRLVEMGLSDDEAKEFVAELVPQIEVEIPNIEAAIEAADFHQIERLTHSIKGSATNLGTGGVSDLLVDFNTYVKSGTDSDVAKAYLKHLIHYTNELKTQYA